MGCESCLYQKDILEIKGDVKAIRGALLGDDFNQKGLIKEHELLMRRESINNKAVNQRIDRTNKRLLFYTGVATGVAAAIGYVISLFKS